MAEPITVNMKFTNISVSDKGVYTLIEYAKERYVIETLPKGKVRIFSDPTEIDFILRNKEGRRQATEFLQSGEAYGL